MGLILLSFKFIDDSNVLCGMPLGTLLGMLFGTIVEK